MFISLCGCIHMLISLVRTVLILACLFDLFRADILKNEMKVFFVKYNDPIYVKLEKLDIMIRLANQQNIAQVLAELKE